MKNSILLLSFVFLISCGRDSSENMKTIEPFSFQNGFEVAGNDISELLPSDGSKWTNIQQVNPNNGTNEITISTDIVNQGNNSLRILAKPSDDILSKADIEKQGFTASIGSTIKIEADFYINTTENLTDLFLMDLECCSCWDPSVPDNQCPGIRLKIGGDNEYLSIERGKILSPTITQADFSFPKFEWVRVTWEMELSPETNGKNKLSINGQEAISSNGINMPNAGLFGAEFASHGIEFELQKPIAYERVQIGVTANGTSNSIEMYVDNFKLTIE